MLDPPKQSGNESQEDKEDNLLLKQSCTACLNIDQIESLIEDCNMGAPNCILLK